jgi:aspartyl-tRNA(Asn)/glutamyl-tRNA(Gln) amidotransferase subunit A
VASHAGGDTEVSDFYWLTAAEIASAFKAGKLSPVEITRQLLARIDRLNPTVNALVTVDRDGAEAQARRAESEMKAGRVRGPLHGVPVAIKDIIDVAGLPTTCQSRRFKDHVAASDAFVVARLREAGAIILGKAATWEFAIGGASDDAFPAARNPWNLKCHPGGSSSGSGAGLAAGFFPLAIGTDTGGSIRHPAGASGVVGFKPTYGLVSRRGVFPLSFTLDHVGPMARGVEDVAALLDCIAARDSSDPSSVAGPKGSYTSGLQRGLRGVRIGFVRHFHEKDVVADPEVAAAIENAAAVLKNLGASVEDATLPPLPSFAAVNRIIMHGEAWSIHRHWLQTEPENYGQITRRRLMSGAFLPAGAYVSAQRSRLQLIEAVNNAFGKFDLLVAANAMDPAGTPAEFDSGMPVNMRHRQARTPFNVTGHPAIAMMTGLSKAGMPMAMQIVGRHFDDALVLQAAAAFERETPHHNLHPKL